ncbi:glycosyltransferase [Varibaculum vaginae]|uniref:glycosyltransferase n=1 Tax=Varibaculum vaginae TaxID=2364797 RepID=UPI000F08A145|nr:glycosyltransferase [Varibaculum vaginae]
MAPASESSAPYRHPSVQVFITTRGRTPYLEQTLKSLRASRYPVSSLVVVDSDPNSDLTPSELRPYAPLHYSQVKAANLGQAVCTARADNLAAVDYLWLLHDDSAPDSACLGELVQAFENSTTLGIAGPKALDWDKPKTLASVGIHATRSGERLIPFDPGEVDQGQYDGISDVLAVSTAGLLIKAQLWDRLRGTSPLLSRFSEALELGRRARMAGYRVCLVPEARIYHAQAGLYRLRKYLQDRSLKETAAEKDAENNPRGRLKQLPKSEAQADELDGSSLDSKEQLTVDKVSSLSEVSSGAAGNLAKEDDLLEEKNDSGENDVQEENEGDNRPEDPDAPVPHQPVYVYDPVPVTPLAARAPREKRKSWATRRADSYIYRALTINSLLLPLWVIFLPFKSVLLALYWVLQSQGQRGAVEIHSANRVWGLLGKIFSARRIQRRQSQISRRELSRLEVPASQLRKNRRLIRRVNREHGQTALKLGAVAKTQLENISWRAQIIFWSLSLFFLVSSLLGMRAFLGGMHGGFWSVLPGNWRDFWFLATNSWRTLSTGVSGSPDPITYPLLVVTAPFAIFGIAPTAVLQWLLIFSPLGAAICAWIASSAFTRVNPLRALITLSWGAALPLLLSMQAGNVPAVLCHIFLPLVVWGVLSYYGLRRPYFLAGVLDTEEYLPNYSRRSAAGIGALTLIIVSAAAPWFWLVALALVLGCTLSAKIKKPLSFRRLFLQLGGGVAILIPALLTLLPSLIWALRTHSLSAYLFLTPSTFSPLSMRSQLQVMGQVLSGLPLILGIASFVCVLLAAIGALFTGRELLGTRMAWMFTLVGIVIGIVSVTQIVAPGQRPWPLPVFSLLLMGLLAATALGWGAVQPVKPWRYLLGSLIALALVFPLATIATWAIPAVNTPLKAGADRAPVAFSILSASEKRTRMLLIDRAGRKYRLAMRRDAGPGMLATNWEIRVKSPKQIAAPENQILASLVAGNDLRAAKICADLAVEQLLITKQAAVDGLNARLASSSYFHPVLANADYSVWRLDTSKFSPPRSDARVRIAAGKQQETVPSGILNAEKNISSSSKQRQLLLAEAPSSAWKARIGGHALQSRSEGGLQSFTIPAGNSGKLELYFANPVRYLMIGIFLLVYLGAFAACLPLAERSERK